MDLGLTGKRVLIAGAGGDVGRATALVLAREGAVTTLVGRTRKTLEETAALVRDLGGVAHVVPGDAGSSEAVTAIVTKAVEIMGGLDALANTIGPFPSKWREIPGFDPLYGNDESWADNFQAVFMGPVRLVRECLMLMKRNRHGAIVTLAANSAKHHSAGTAQYAAMKAALAHITKNWARDAIRSGVRVNAVLPGWIRTAAVDKRIAAEVAREGLSDKAIEQKLIEAHENVFWSGRMGGVEEYAQVIAFLLSDRASYVNGVLLSVDGGSAAG
ncbi:MAG: SDR family oxidoreductase [Sphingobium sp.]